jgi:hypothetical protein
MASPEVTPWPVKPPTVPKGGLIVGHGHGPRSAFECRWAANRPRGHRPPPVRAGDTVFYRSNDFTEPSEAIVVQVLDTEDNPQEYTPDGRRVDDPWFHVLLRLNPDKFPPSWDKRQRALAQMMIRTQEARLRGSAGYLHPLWEMYPQPAVGAVSFGDTLDEQNARIIGEVD